MRRLTVLTMAMALAFMASCGGKEEKSPAKEMAVRRVSNPATPLKGKVKVQLEEKFRWSPQEPEEGLYVIDFARGPEGSLFVLFTKNYKIYKISREGKVVKVFSGKGEGPGEFKFSPRLKIYGNSLWAASSRKVVEFDLDGNLLGEFHLKKLYRGITPIGKDEFLGSNLSFEGEGEKSKLVIFNSQEKVLRQLWESEKSRFVYIKIGDRPFVFAYGPPIHPWMRWAYQPDSGLVYITEAENYEIWVKDLQGKVRFVISRQYERKPFSEEEKDKFVGMFEKMPPEVRKALKKRLPDHLCSIYDIKALPHGYLLVMSVKDKDNYYYDVFGPQGKFLYQLEFPKRITLAFKIYPDATLAMLTRKKDQEFYVEYRIKNLPEIFGK